jgi:alpha-beta hydrolase superfamily lysophospholipase
MTSDSYLSPFTASDGQNIALHDWPLTHDSAGSRPRGHVIIVHGLGEHAFRHAHVAQVLNQVHFHVRAYDQYGHGESGGVRGCLPHEMRLMHDLADVVDDTRRTMQPGEPLILLGHSMGGLVAASFVRHRLRPVDGLILSSPALDPGLSGLQKLLLATLPHIAPNLCVDNGLNVEKVARDPKVVQAYRNDPLVHRKISARLARFIADEGARCIAAAAQWQTPTLLLYSGADALVSPAGSRAFTAAAPQACVQSLCFEAMYHEIFNDPEREQVFDAMRTWLNHHFA